MSSILVATLNTLQRRGGEAGGTSFRMCIETFVDIIRRPLWRQPRGGNFRYEIIQS